MKKLCLMLFAVLICTKQAFAEEDTGRIYISKLETETSWQGNQTANRNSVFEIVVNNTKLQKISKDHDGWIRGLALRKKHLVEIKLEGKTVESFYFQFEDYNCPRLWLDYYEIYGEWMLKEGKSCYSHN